MQAPVAPAYALKSDHDASSSAPFVPLVDGMGQLTIMTNVIVSQVASLEELKMKVGHKETDVEQIKFHVKATLCTVLLEEDHYQVR